MEKLIDGKDSFEIVDKIPYGYAIWNIGKNMKDGYLPLVQVGGYDGYQVNPNTMKAVRVKDAQIILSAISQGEDTVKKMEAYINKHQSSKVNTTESHYEKVVKALEVMYTIPGAENLDEYNRMLKAMRKFL